MSLFYCNECQAESMQAPLCKPCDSFLRASDPETHARHVKSRVIQCLPLHLALQYNASMSLDQWDVYYTAWLAEGKQGA